jgi:cytochrome c556
MSMIAMWFKKILIITTITAVGLGVPPLVNVYAQSVNPPSTPVPGQPSSDKLQKAWTREQAIYARIGKILDGANNLISRIQSRLDEAKAKGKDVSSVQSALDDFSAAVKTVQPIYADMQTIVQSHSGFDATGNVIDRTQALKTVQDFRSKVEGIRQAGVGEAGKALRDAVKAFRQANQSLTPTPSPSTSNG